MRRELVIALALLVLTLGLMRYVATADVTVERLTFDRFPEEVMGMRAVEQPISAPILDTLGVTDYLSRRYLGVQGKAPPVELYIGFYASQRTGSTYHSPKNCLPGGGWQMVDINQTTVQRGADPVRVNEIIIQRGLQKQVVLYWYQDRGRVVASEYHAKVLMIWDAALRHRTDGALVRIIVPVGADEMAARSAARTFATAVLPLLSGYLPG